MIVGTGIDIIEVDRLAEKLGKENGFREKVFSQGEIAFCEHKPNKAEHYAARFAAKEAFLKATGLGLLAGTDLHLIEVFADEAGKPYMRFYGAFDDLVKKNHWQSIHVSLSHIKSIACAVVVIEK
jgi:holo-[acyl-carrier protein] synthase